MKIIDLLKKNAIELNASVASKNDAIDKLIALHEKAGNLLDVNEYKKAILAREAQGSTAIGEGIAVPHAKSESVKTPGLSAITVQNGVDYGAPDGKNSDILFMIAAPLDGDLHLEILSRLMVMLMEPEFCAALRSAKTADEFKQLLNRVPANQAIVIDVYADWCVACQPIEHRILKSVEVQRALAPYFLIKLD